MSGADDSWPTLETARLRLRRFREDDLAPFMAYRNDPEVARYQSWERISLPEAQALIQAVRVGRLGVPGEGVQIAWELRATGALVGDCYFHIEAARPQQAELGYTLASEAQGQGLATEALGAWLSYAFAAYDLQRVYAIVDGENRRSIELLARLGFRLEDDAPQRVWFKGHWSDEYRYAISREEWAARHSASLDFR
ncbi:MAG TPA: GNAT family protein [Ktedonobacterales bacterium]|nr:GNAT family protein [Ktedonobacterales bacterium]